MDEQSLAEAVRGAQDGDPAAFDRLIEAFSRRIFGFLYRVTGSAHEAEDLMQEVFLRVVRRIGAYRDSGRFEAWIFRIAANLARDRVRRLGRTPIVASGGRVEAGVGPRVPEEFAAVSAEADAGLRRREELDALSAALEVLPEAEREVIMLRHFSQMSFKEIAEITGSPLGTALARAHRGLARLRELMGAPCRTGRSREPGVTPSVKG